MLKFMSSDWLSNIYDFENQIFSQGKQDGVIEYIIQNIPIKNKFCVEFGYNSRNFFLGGSGANTTNLIKNRNWNYLLLDSNYENKQINLHRHLLTEDNVCDIFKMYNVPEEPGYVSIDVDSTDLWLTNAILKIFRPSFYSVEFNLNFPIDYAITFPKNDPVGWTGDRIFGASLKALDICANNNQYTLVYAGLIESSFNHDAFFIRNDLISNCDKLPSLENFRFTFTPFHYPCITDRYKIMIDYEEYLLTKDLEKSQKKAEHIAKTYLC